jgi:hypothetical protein
VLAMVRSHGRFGPIPGTDLNWNEIDFALFYGKYGLPGGEHLYQVAAKHGHETDWAQVLREKSFPHRLIAGYRASLWVAEYFKRHGKLPMPTDEPVCGTNITWQQLHQRTNYLCSAFRDYGYTWIEAYIRTNRRQPEPSEEIIHGTQITWRELQDLGRDYDRQKSLGDAVRQLIKWRPELAKQNHPRLNKSDVEQP